MWSTNALVHARARSSFSNHAFERFNILKSQVIKSESSKTGITIIRTVLKMKIGLNDVRNLIKRCLAKR